MVKFVRYFLVQSAVISLVYFGLFLGDEGLANILVCWAWFCFVASLIVSSNVGKENLRKDGVLLYHWSISTALCLIVAVPLAYFGYIFTGIMYVFACGIVHSAKKQAIIEQ